MTLRDALGVDVRQVHERVDDVLDIEDGVSATRRPSSGHQLLAGVCSIWLPDRWPRG
jgi:hypothetical protein